MIALNTNQKNKQEEQNKVDINPPNKQVEIDVLDLHHTSYCTSCNIDVGYDDISMG